jgi:hypothetical protein
MLHYIDMLHKLYRLYINTLLPTEVLCQDKLKSAKSPLGQKVNFSIIDFINYIDNRYMNSQLLQLLKVI